MLTDTTNMANSLEHTDRAINSQQMLSDLLTAYIGDKLLTKFKNEKLSIYHRVI